MEAQAKDVPGRVQTPFVLSKLQVTPYEASGQRRRASAAENGTKPNSCRDRIEIDKEDIFSFDQAGKIRAVGVCAPQDNDWQPAQVRASRFGQLTCKAEFAEGIRVNKQEVGAAGPRQARRLLDGGHLKDVEPAMSSH